MALTLVAANASAQELLPVGGTILRLTQVDSIPAGGVLVVLHQVGRDFQGPVDSTSSGVDGSFRFDFIPDTAAVYILSASHAGVQYFSPPVHTNPERPDTAILIVVSDTSTTARIEVASRQVVVGAPRTDGTREVIDLVGLENPGWQTRVPGHAQRPTWSTPLSDAVIGFNVGASDFSPEAVFFRNGRVEVLGPIAPGAKDLLLKYLIPASSGNLAFAFADTAREFSLLIEEPDLRVSGPVMEAPEPQVISGRAFRTWRSRPAPGDTIAITFPGAVPRSSRPLLAALVGVVGLALLITAWRIRRGHAEIPLAEEPVPVLVRRLALLDARYRGRQADVPASEWTQYQEDRQTLKARLTRALAGAGTTG